MDTNPIDPEAFSLQRRSLPEDLRDCADHLACARWGCQDVALALSTWEIANRPLSPREQTVARTASLQIYVAFKCQQIPRAAAG